MAAAGCGGRDEVFCLATRSTVRKATPKSGPSAASEQADFSHAKVNQCFQHCQFPLADQLGSFEQHLSFDALKLLLQLLAPRVLVARSPMLEPGSAPDR